MAGCKNQLIMKYCSKFLVSIIVKISSLLTLKIYHCKHSGLDFLLRNINDNQHS